MIYIDDIFADEVLDSRGNPTIRATIALNNGITCNAIVPSGASTGKREALELRDGDKSRFLGKGVLNACKNVNTTIAEKLIGLSPFNQSEIDNIMKNLDGSDNYSKLGANAVLGISMAITKAAAYALEIPLYRYIGGVNANILPVPMLNIINGGSHADNTVDFQEYMIMPLGFNTFRDALKASAEVYGHLKNILKENGHITSIGDEGGFAPNLKNNEEPIEMILKAIKKAGYKDGEQIAIALDVASSEFVDNKKEYFLSAENRRLDSKELVSYYESLCAKYPIVSIEDGLSEDDWEGWKYLTDRLGGKIQLVGDDLFVTNEKILREGIDKNIANAVLIKPNQIGSVTQTMQAVRLAQRNKYKCIMSHRSGESEDTFIADFAVGLNMGEIKTGSTARSERIAKYNRLLEIENELDYSEYLGWRLFK
ncbi:phosphopyruvate hydratase [Helicobacter sp. MIT 99-5507]|uniref:phosphopyruvate hydratase n=1 Tax=Helicobacter sp. MIT 99-5507 TaxID=152489 RepID=UPI000E1F66D6|nr:phosphopyruvate hydratase [Helicobacter sp. MIT 99-5507]RDU57574.1 phosphopyruvate hydratase [Helicobacter sp. MIT 99-5507]